jgi:hypothetical protein
MNTEIELFGQGPGMRTQLSPDGVLGFFELDEAGMVRFSSTVGTRPGEESRPDIGEDFFEYAAFQNREDLRRIFRGFVESREPADSFLFDCFFDNLVVHTKVTFTRAYQTELFPPEGIVMLSIRESE